MKVCTITFLNASNFGAALQCAALSHILKNFGLDTEVINYAPHYVKDKQGAFKEIKKAYYTFKETYNIIYFARGLLKGTYYAMHYPVLLKRQKAFKKFLNTNITLTKEYSNFSDLGNCAAEADIIICGSDQIWNPVLTGGSFDPAYFLKFAGNETKKISYGISFGELNIADNAKELSELSEGFAAISVRERSSAAALTCALKREVSVVLDPTMLMSEKEYVSMEAAIKINRPYLLIYNIQNSALSTEIAIRIARKKGLEIIDISPNPLKRIGNSKKLVSIGPGEFLSYIKKADYIITNSFHGTVFSVIYRKEFLTIPHSSRSGRMVDLLNDLGLKERIISEMSYVDKLDSDIDYTEVHKKLNVLKKSSIDYLKTAVFQQNG